MEGYEDTLRAVREISDAKSKRNAELLKELAEEKEKNTKLLTVADITSQVVAILREKARERPVEYAKYITTLLSIENALRELQTE